MMTMVRAGWNKEDGLLQQQASKLKDNNVMQNWVVYVDQSKASLERGGATTLDAFLCLAQPSNQVVVKAAIFSKPPKGKGPYVRCVPLLDRGGNLTAFEVSNVNSVEKVHRILTKHMKLTGITVQMCDCLKLKYKGNGYLEAKKVPLAIEAFDRALEMGILSQRGVLMLVRSTAYSALAASHRQILQSLVDELRVPSQSSWNSLNALSAAHHQYGNEIDKDPDFSLLQLTGAAALSNAVLRRLMNDVGQQEKQMRKIQYWHGLYQHAMLKALEDAAEATHLLDGYAPAWERRGGILLDLWRLEESLECYKTAEQLDPTLSSLKLALVRLEQRRNIISAARSIDTWPQDHLQLALDVQG